jgi:hypothetical protein
MRYAREVPAKDCDGIAGDKFVGQRANSTSTHLLDNAGTLLEACRSPYAISRGDGCRLV